MLGKRRKWFRLRLEIIPQSIPGWWLNYLKLFGNFVLYFGTKVAMFNSEHVLDKLGKLTNRGDDSLVWGKGWRWCESVNVTVHQGIDFGRTWRNIIRQMNHRSKKTMRIAEKLLTLSQRKTLRPLAFRRALCNTFLHHQRLHPSSCYTSQVHWVSL